MDGRILNLHVLVDLVSVIIVQKLKYVRCMNGMINHIRKRLSSVTYYMYYVVYMTNIVLS